jgi:predicted nucleic acid-binding protein
VSTRRRSVLVDTGPLVSATIRREPAHDLAAGLIAQLGRLLIVPVPVLVETDLFLRKMREAPSARLFLAALAAGAHEVMYLTPGLLRRAVQIDARYADLGLGLVDAAVMACAERHDLPILTFDFRHFRAAPPERGAWRLIVDEERYAALTTAG